MVPAATRGVAVSLPYALLHCGPEQDYGRPEERLTQRRPSPARNRAVNRSTCSKAQRGTPIQRSNKTQSQAWARNGGNARAHPKLSVCRIAAGSASERATVIRRAQISGGRSRRTANILYAVGDAMRRCWMPQWTHNNAQSRRSRFAIQSVYLGAVRTRKRAVVTPRIAQRTMLAHSFA